jgi:site-specific recombinase XerD
MTENRLPDYLGHMLDAARQACGYVEGMDKDDFLADKRTQQAVILNSVIIGEAATKLLRHSTGYKLANDGHDTRSIQQYLGHKNITHTVRYTELSPERFKKFWKD